MNEKNIEKDEKIESSSSISSNDLFTTIYDITRAIFRHLPIRSIDSCSSVCQSWYNIGRLTKEHRYKIHAITYPLSLTTNFSNDLSDFDKYFSSYIDNNLWSLPYLALVVVTNDFEKKGFYSLTNSLSSSSSAIKKLKRRHSYTEYFDISQALIRHLNKSCKILLIVSDGIIVSNDENQSNEIESNDAMGMILFPKFPSNILGIYPFEITRNTQISSDMSREDLHRLLGCVPNDIPIRCVIFFLIQHQTSTIDCIKKLIEYYSTDVAIIGGFIKKIRYNDRITEQKKTSYNTYGIVLTGDTNHLNIRQIVLDNHIKTREDIRNKLKQLKSIENKQDLSFAIQISCVARGKDFYNNEQNVECSEFRNLFPNTPLIGIFGNGELGHDLLLHNNHQINTRQTTKDLFRTYSTIFSLISIRI